MLTKKHYSNANFYRAGAINIGYDCAFCPSPINSLKLVQIHNLLNVIKCLELINKFIQKNTNTSLYTSSIFQSM